MVEWPFKDSVMVTASYKAEKHLSGCRIHEMGNRGIETNVIPFTVTISDPLEKRSLPIHTARGSAGLEVLVPKGIILPWEDTKISPPRNWTSIWSLWTLHATESTGKEGRYFDSLEWLILSIKRKPCCQYTIGIRRSILGIQKKNTIPNFKKGGGDSVSSSGKRDKCFGFYLV